MKDKDVRQSLNSPYWATETDEDTKLPGYDFCREIIEPGTNETFPDGAVGIRVDDDFWAVAALPLEYRSWKLPDLVKNLWSGFEGLRASYHPDSGTLEQRIEQLEGQVFGLERARAHLEADRRRLERVISKFPPARRRILDANEQIE